MLLHRTLLMRRLSFSCKREACNIVIMRGVPDAPVHFAAICANLVIFAAKLATYFASGSR